MASETDIRNNALLLLGIEPINDPSDRSPPAIVTQGLYASCRDGLLRVAAWKFATARSTLARTTSPGGDEWTYGYALPADYLSDRGLNEIDGYSGDRYEIAGDDLLTNASTALLRYTRQVTDASRFDPLFREALEAKLAMTCAPSLAAPLAGAMKQLYQEKLAEALLANANEGSAQRIASDAIRSF